MGGLGHLLRSYWGGYVAVEARQGGLEILRDPSGALGCYRAQAEGMLLFASDLNLLLAGGAIVPGIDWDGLTSILGSSGLPKKIATVSSLVASAESSASDLRMPSSVASSSVSTVTLSAG